MPEFENESLAEWLEEVVRQLLENGADYAVFASKRADGDVILAAYNTNPGQKLELAAQIQADAILDAIEARDSEEYDDEQTP